MKGGIKLRPVETGDHSTSNSRDGSNTRLTERYTFTLEWPVIAGGLARA